MAIFSIAKMIFSSLLRKESTYSYPLKKMERDPLVRGHVDNDIEACIFCGVCERKCPTAAIGVNKRDSTWEISRFKCIVCNCCVETCPKKCLYMKSELTPVSDKLTKDVRKSEVKNA
jgi:formate hydrogenlyase subunit 6/NADH:ubiquinone oxidoreductase subunit I